MRSDMKKILCEYGRNGGYNLRKGRPDPFGEEGEFFIKHEGIAPRNTYDRKKRKLRMSPLYRYLRSKIGCKWDDVYSELAKGGSLESSYFWGRTLKEEAKSWIAIEAFFDEKGEVYENWNGRRVYNLGLYVHPETGIICEAEKKKRVSYWKLEREKREANRRVISNKLQYHKVKGIWYAVTLTDIECVNHVVKLPGKTLIIPSMKIDGKLYNYFYDAVIGNFSYKDATSDILRDTYGRKNVCGTNKRTLSKRELKTHGLTNS